jgi:hypothetical protein
VNRSIFTASLRTLKILAAAVWYIGSIILLLKGSQLLLEADSMFPGLPWIWLAVVSGEGQIHLQQKLPQES